MPTVLEEKVTMLVPTAPPASVTGVVPMLTVRPAGVFEVTARATGPAKPWTARLPAGRLPSVIVAVPVEPELKVTVIPLLTM